MRYHVVIERGDRTLDAFGPYPDAVAAAIAMDDSLLISSECEEDCLDCYVFPEQHLDGLRGLTRHVIDPTDPDHTAGDDVTRDLARPVAARQYQAGDEVMLAEGTDPWLQWPDGRTVTIGQYLTHLGPGACGECWGGLFGPTGNGPTSHGIERCDACDAYPGDLDAASALAATISLLGPDATVWYLPESEEN